MTVSKLIEITETVYKKQVENEIALTIVSKDGITLYDIDCYQFIETPSFNMDYLNDEEVFYFHIDHDYYGDGKRKLNLHITLYREMDPVMKGMLKSNKGSDQR